MIWKAYLELVYMLMGWSQTKIRALVRAISLARWEVVPGDGDPDS